MSSEIDRLSLFKITHGLYIVTSSDDGKLNGLICDALMQVTDTPPQVTVSINKKELTHEYIEKSGAFAVSVLDVSTPFEFIGLFGFKSGRDVDKLSQVSFREGVTGCPVVTENAVAFVEAKVVKSVDVGTHTLFVGEIEASGIIMEGTPMTYTYYRQHLKGKTPEYAPGYSAGKAEENSGLSKGSEKMQKYVCTICGYVYDPEMGDPGNGVKPGTAFEDVPDDWVCPICGAAKDQFKSD